MVLVGVDRLEDGADALVDAELLVVQALLLVDRAEQHGRGDAALAVDLDGDDVLGGGLELEPGAAVRDQLGGGEAPAGRGVDLGGEVGAGRADELRDHDALGAVDDEGPVVRHHGHVAHEQLLLLDLARLLDQEFDAHAHRRRVGALTVAALGLRVLGLLEVVLAEAEFHPATGEVLDRRDLVEELSQPLPQESLVRASGHVDQVWHLHDMECAPEVLLQVRYFLQGGNDAAVNGQAILPSQTRRERQGRVCPVAGARWMRAEAGRAGRHRKTPNGLGSRRGEKTMSCR